MNCHTENPLPPNTEASPDITIDVVEVAFKAGRIGIYANRNALHIPMDAYVVVQADKGLDMGKVTQRGHSYGLLANDDETSTVIRVAEPGDLLRLNANRQQEDDATRLCKDMIIDHRLKRNLVDTEYQWDKNKLTFYFTAEERVDFRKRVRDLAGNFRTRIELRQIGVRDAARHVGGYGACGCQLCCTLFLKKFENITTQYIKDQLIPMSPSRMTGICGRLKCCLAFERDFYIEELSKYPTVGNAIQTPDGNGTVDKVDIFNGVVYVRSRENDISRYTCAELSENHAS